MDHPIIIHIITIRAEDITADLMVVAGTAADTINFGM
jgi:hypothetical protein